MRQIVLILHNLRSTHNVGSLIRTSDGLGVHEVFCTGYTPYPTQENDTRLPHEQRKITKQIAKTSLGAEETMTVTHQPDISDVIHSLRAKDYQIVALEQASDSVQLPDYQPAENIAIIVGREVEGLEPEVISAADTAVEIPMQGKKESYNVAVAGAIALYHCRFAP